MPRFVVSGVRVVGVWALVWGAATGYFQLDPLPADADAKAISVIVGLAALATALLCELLVVLLPAPASSRKVDLRLVSSEKDLDKELFRGADSVVESAREWLIVTGSRSHEAAYLKAIQDKLVSGDICYARILVGPPHHEVLRDHLKWLTQYSALASDGRREKVAIVETPYGAAWPERFICANEHKAVIVIQSLNRPHGFDTGVVIDDPILASKMMGQLKAVVDELKRGP